MSSHYQLHRLQDDWADQMMHTCTAGNLLWIDDNTQISFGLHDLLAHHLACMTCLRIYLQILKLLALCQAAAESFGITNVLSGLVDDCCSHSNHSRITADAEPTL